MARGIAELARERNVEAVPHCFSTGVLVAASLHFRRRARASHLVEVSVADSPFVSGLLKEPFAFSDGTLRIPAGPGLGIELNEELLERMRVG